MVSGTRENQTEEQLPLSNNANETACIMAFTSDVQKMLKGDYKPIEFVTYYQCSKCNTWCYRGKCSVSCGHWPKLKLNDHEKKDLQKRGSKASINLLDHLHELIPNAGGKVGLVTYQNGINNGYDADFLKMGETIKSNLKEENPLCIGLYNRSWTIGLDLLRMQCEFLGVRTEVVRCKRKMFTTLANRLLNLNDHPHWLHIAHSEGGLITRDTLDGLKDTALNYCLNHLIVHTYGSVQPIARSAAKDVLNTYATYDVAYRMYGSYYEKRSEYNINVVDSSEKPLIPIPGDHGFLGVTYPIALKTNIDKVRDLYEIYDAKN